MVTGTRLAASRMAGHALQLLSIEIYRLTGDRYGIEHDNCFLLLFELHAEKRRDEWPKTHAMGRIGVVAIVFWMATAIMPAAARRDEAAVLLVELSRQGKYAEATPLAERALALIEKAFRPDHPNLDHARKLGQWPGRTFFWGMGYWPLADRMARFEPDSGPF